jgi:elongation factor 1-beta
MGEVAITFKVMPDGAETDIEVLKKKIDEEMATQSVKLQGVGEKPIAFGLKALIVKVVVEDKEGLLDTIENALQGIDGVQSIETLEMGRLL